MKTIYSLMIAVMSVVMLTACGASDGASCKDNPFGATCGDDFADTRDEIITECIQRDLATSTICAAAVKANPCIENPFDDNCETTFADYYEIARSSRVGLCGFGGDFYGSLCPETDVICNYDPFKHVCHDRDYSPLRDKRIAFCRETANANNIRCTGLEVTQHICRDEPFHAVCFDERGTHEGDRFNYCITGDNVREKNCEEHFAEDSCVRDPFADGCDRCYKDYLADGCDVGENSYFRRVFTTARDNRIKFCIMAENVTSGLCEKANIAINNCISNPFTARCTANDNFDRYILLAQSNRVNFCSDDANLGNDLCPQGFLDCISSPFDQGCDITFGSYHNTIQFEFCGKKTNVNNSSCTDALSRPTAATWLQSFDTDLATVINPSDDVSRFLQGIAIEEFNGPSTSQNFLRYQTLNLATGDSFSNNILGGDKEDGVAFFSRYVIAGTEARYYAGIFSTTDLGALRTETSGTAEWKGRISAIGYNVNKDFILTVNFGAGEQAGTISASVSSLSLTGNFNNSGIITGKVQLPTRNAEGEQYINTGIMTGLIGEEGAVGVFISDPERRDSYSGGFVARPPN